MAEGAVAYFEDHGESKDLGRRALRGGVASVAMQYGNGFLQLTGAVVLARLLAPEDFGLVAIVAVLTSFAPLLVDFGLGDATTQRRTITEGQVSSLFWVSSGIGLAIAAVVAACSPLIAWIYQEPRLETIAQYSAITFVLAGASNQHMALLRRTMQFTRTVEIQVFSTLAGIAVAIFAATHGFGYWALVLRPIATAFCVTIGAWLACRWRPGIPVIDNEVKSMMRFGMHVVGFSLSATVARTVDRIGLGLFYKPVEVGYYQNAITLYDNSIFSTFQQLHTVGSAALSKLQANPAALRQNYQAALSAVAFFVMPAAVVLSVTAQDLTAILLGEKWRTAGYLLSIIALRGIPQVVEGSQGWLHLSIGTVDRWRNWGIVTLVVQIAAVMAGLPFGTTGVATAVVMASVVLAAPSISYAGRPIGIDAALVLQTVGRQLVGAMSAVAGGWWLQTTALVDFSSFVRILFATSFCISIYVVVVVGVFRLTEPIKVAGAVVQDLLKNR